MNTKQVIVIRKDLKMRRGKEISQGSHASMAWLTKRITQSLVASMIDHSAQPGWIDDIPMSKPEKSWVTGIFTKVVCQVSSESALREVYEKAKAAGLEAHLIEDCGKTEFGGVVTPTAVGIGPDETSLIDAVTGNLELY